MPLSLRSALAVCALLAATLAGCVSVNVKGDPDAWAEQMRDQSTLRPDYVMQRSLTS